MWAPGLRFSVDATSPAWNFVEVDCPAGEWTVERPLRNVLNLVTKEALFLKLFQVPIIMAEQRRRDEINKEFLLEKQLFQGDKKLNL